MPGRRECLPRRRDETWGEGTWDDKDWDGQMSNETPPARVENGIACTGCLQTETVKGQRVRTIAHTVV